MLMASTPLGSNPARSSSNARKLRTSSPAATRSSTANSTSVATSARRTPLRPTALPRPPAATPARRSVRPTCNAGSKPIRRPVTIVTPTAKASTGALMPISPARGNEAGRSASSVWTSQYASTIPTEPPTSAMSTFSVSSCRARRPRPAPSTVRIVISRDRPAARARLALARFTHATSSTTTTAPRSRRK